MSDTSSASFLTDDSGDLEKLVVDVSDWSEGSQVALAEAVEGLAQLEESIGGEGPTAVQLAKFRHSLFLLLRDLRSRDLIEPFEIS